ncbi:hypothetical protein B0H14DRAFT_2700995 [Mycena olivaceomarginata]|nr:hypothetical protein B0H14DRAFT_2700995 [Mycena olivaceomarginata]
MVIDGCLRLVVAVVGLLRPQFCARGIRLGSEFGFDSLATVKGLPYTQVLSVPTLLCGVPFPVSGLIQFVALRNFLLLVGGQILDLGAFPDLCHTPCHS